MGDLTTSRPDPLYVAARRSLLNALDALRPHLGAVVVVGAQAVYLRTGSSDLGIAPYTTDGDLALDPTILGDHPELGEAMRGAGFQILADPGTWLATELIDGESVTIPVDLIVPEALAGNGRRAARLDGHGARDARRAVGLEAALVDHSPLTINALESGDERAVEVNVAGASALFVAKAHKLSDRSESGKSDRLHDKDAIDVYRLMTATNATETADRFRFLLTHETSAETTRSAVAILADLFGKPTSVGVQMAARGLNLAVPKARVEAIATAYVKHLVKAIGE